MNRCQVCDKTDEDDPKAGITIVNNETICRECSEVIFQNLEDLSINDDIAIDYNSIVEDDNWFPATLPVFGLQE